MNKTVWQLFFDIFTKSIDMYPYYKMMVENNELTYDENFAKKLKQNNEKIVLMMHYPPFNAKFQDSPFTEKIAQHGIKTVIYGHLHGGNGRFAPIVNKGDTDYFLTSCDMLDNKLIDLTDYIK